MIVRRFSSPTSRLAPKPVSIRSCYDRASAPARFTRVMPGVFEARQQHRALDLRARHRKPVGDRYGRRRAPEISGSVPPAEASMLAPICAMWDQLPASSGGPTGWRHR